jgi:hypothetical protein
VLRENFSETIGSFNEIIDFGSGHISSSTETEFLRVVNVCSETELTSGFTSNTNGITSQHLDGKTEILGFVDGTGGIVTRRIHTRHDTHDFPLLITTATSNTERSETTRGKFSDLVLVIVDDFVGKRMIFLDRSEDEKGRALDADETFAFRGFDDSGNLLGDRVEGVEFDDFVLAEDALCTRIMFERLQESFIDGIETLGFSGGGETGCKHEIVGIDAFDGVGFVKRKFVLG